MTIEEAIKLIDSGFTRDDIMKLSEVKSEETQPPEAEEKRSEAQKAPETPPEPSKVPETDSDAETVKSLTEQVKSLTETIKALQKEAAKSDQSKPPEKVTADSIIKNFFGEKKVG